MTTKQPTRDEWQALYDTMRSVGELAPWAWMEETDLFAVQNPETDELGFVSVMGNLGEHLGIAVYLGPAGLEGFRAMQEAGSPPQVANILLETPQLQASFEDREQLEKAARDVIKSLGLKFRGRSAWPLFRSFRPGFVPWKLAASEARYLTAALGQLLAVAPRFRETPMLIRGVPKGKVLCRSVLRTRTGGWADRLAEEPLPGRDLTIFIDAVAFERLKGLPSGRDAFEVDFFRMPGGVQQKGGPPRVPYVVLIAHAKSGMILGAEAMTVEATLDDLWGRIPLKVSQVLARQEALPRELRLRDPMVKLMLGPLAQDLGLRLTETARLPNADAAKRSFFETFG